MILRCAWFKIWNMGTVCVFAVYVGISTLIEFIKEILSPLELTNYLNL
jgi:hypothetical protein